MFILFWLVVLVLVVALIKWAKTPESKESDDKYQQGYYDGYWALGDRIRKEIQDDSIDIEAIKKLVTNEFDEQQDVAHPKVVAESSASGGDGRIALGIGSSEKTEAEKEAQSVKNLNTLLFVASLLFVAAGAAFVATSMPDVIKLAGIWALAAIFYLAGMILNDTPKLKAAGTAFIGTSLGIVPFAGVALYQLGGLPGGVVWTTTSFIGLAAYLFAALRLQSQTVAYLTMAFVVSLAASLSASVSLPMMWSFVFMIVVSLLANIAAILKPNWVPRVFAESIERTGQLVTPLALIISLVLMSKMSLLSYEVVFGVATLHYLVAWLQARGYYYESVARGLLHVTLALVVWDLADDYVISGMVFVLLAATQQVYSITRWNRNSPVSRAAELAWIIAMQVIQIMSTILFVNSQHFSILTAWTLVAIGTLSLIATLRFRTVWPAVGGALASVVLPIVCVYGVFGLPYENETLAIWYTIGATALVAARAWSVNGRSLFVKYFLEISACVYVGFAVVSSMSFVGVLGGILLAVAALLIWAGSYASSRSYVSIAGNVIAVVAVMKLLHPIGLGFEWYMLWTAWISGGVFYLAYLVLAFRAHDENRARGLLYCGWIVLVLAAMTGALSGDVAVATTLTIIAGAATIAIEGARRKRDDLIELAAYVANIGVIYMISKGVPELNFVFYAHWWAALVACVSIWRNKFSTRLIIAMSLVTLSSGLYALSSGGSYQLLFLIEHLALLVAGVQLGVSWAIRWGLAASCLAVLYFLKDYAFLALGFLGLVLIGIVIWKLSSGKNQAD